MFFPPLVQVFEGCVSTAGKEWSSKFIGQATGLTLPTCSYGMVLNEAFMFVHMRIHMLLHLNTNTTKHTHLGLNAERSHLLVPEDLLMFDCLTWPVAGCHAVCQEKIAMAEKILVECPVKTPQGGWSYIRGILLIKACNMMIILTPLRQSFIPTEGEKLHPHAGRCSLGSEQEDTVGLVLISFSDVGIICHTCRFPPVQFPKVMDNGPMPQGKG